MSKKLIISFGTFPVGSEESALLDWYSKNYTTNRPRYITLLIDCRIYFGSESEVAWVENIYELGKNPTSVLDSLGGVYSDVFNIEKKLLSNFSYEYDESAEKSNLSEQLEEGLIYTVSLSSLSQVFKYSMGRVKKGL